MSTIRAFGDWTKLQGILQKGVGAAGWRASSNKSILQEAHRIRRLMVKSFNAGGPPGVTWPALSENTLAFRQVTGFKGTKPLMRTGDLRNSVSVVKEDEGVFVGFHRETMMPNGKPAYSIMSIHEFGAMIFVPITPQMRKFFIAMFLKTKGRIKPLSNDVSALLIEIPPRPVVGPIWEAEKEQSAKNIISGTLRGIGWGEFANLVG